MNKVYHKSDGIFPKAGTKIIVEDPKDEYGSSTSFRKGDVVYVAEYTWKEQTEARRKSAGIVVNTEPGYHGNWISSWRLAEKEDVTNDLTDEQKQALADKALEAAKKRGYCEETQNILRDLGLPTEPSLKKETITVEVEVTHAAHGNGQVYPSYITVDYGNGHVKQMVATKVTLADGTELTD